MADESSFGGQGMMRWDKLLPMLILQESSSDGVRTGCNSPGHFKSPSLPI